MYVYAAVLHPIGLSLDLDKMAGDSRPGYLQVQRWSMPQCTKLIRAEQHPSGYEAAAKQTPKCKQYVAFLDSFCDNLSL